MFSPHYKCMSNTKVLSIYNNYLFCVLYLSNGNYFCFANYFYVSTGLYRIIQPCVIPMGREINQYSIYIIYSVLA